MNTCKTCKHWIEPTNKDNWREDAMCKPIDPETGKPMKRGFKVRVCKHPSQTRFEAPIERNGFGLTDGSTYFAILVTAEDFGCVRHEIPAS